MHQLTEEEREQMIDQYLERMNSETRAIPTKTVYQHNINGIKNVCMVVE